MELGQQSVLQDWSYRKHLALARLKESEGELDSALDFLDGAKRFYVRSLIPYTRPIEAIKAKIYLRQGRLSKAQAWVSEHEISAEDEISYLREFEHITLARVQMAEYESNRKEGIIQDVLSLLERLLRQAEEQQRLGSMVEILIVTALGHHAVGSTDQAFGSLERALTLARPEGYGRIFVGEGQPMRSLLSGFRGSNEKIPHDKDHKLALYVDKLLSAFTQPKEMRQSELFEPLSKRELEILQLIAPPKALLALAPMMPLTWEPWPAKGSVGESRSSMSQR
jgi:LuxR family maltose regulon positive regulatory protein